MQAVRPTPSAARTLTVEEHQVEAGPSTRPDTSASEEGPSEPPPAGVLRLRGGPLKKQRVVWSEETVDNEGMGKKKSKICCIYHKPRAFDESSDESSCSSDDDDQHSHSQDHARGRRQANGHGHGHEHGGRGTAQRLRDGANVEVESESSESEGGGGDGRARPSRKPRKHHHDHPKANRYDAQPKGDSGGSGGKELKGQGGSV